MGRGIILEGVHSNNEAEYEALIHGLQWCLSNGISRLNVYGDSMLLTKQVQGIWACKSSTLATKMREARRLMGKFQEAQVQFVPRERNKEADALASDCLSNLMVGAASLQEPKFLGSESLHDIWCFLERGEFSSSLTREQRRWLARKDMRYRIINGSLYCMGKDNVLRRVPHEDEIESILEACHEGVCGGHFAHDITSRKILQSGFVWPSLHHDVSFWCKSCDACQRTGPRKLLYEPQTPIKAFGPFEKWGIDAVGPLPRTNSGKEYIIVGVDYMTRWAEARPQVG